MKKHIKLKQAFIKSEIEKINKVIINDEDPSVETITKLTKLNKAFSNNQQITWEKL